MWACGSPSFLEQRAKLREFDYHTILESLQLWHWSDPSKTQTHSTFCLSRSRIVLWTISCVISTSGCSHVFELTRLAIFFLTLCCCFGWFFYQHFTIFLRNSKFLLLWKLKGATGSFLSYPHCCHYPVTSALLSDFSTLLSILLPEILPPDTQGV